jgi:DNA-binding ferritin-like protein
MKNPGEFVLTLLNARTAAHVAHLQVSGPGSYAAHKALADFYDAIPDLADRFAEAYIGCYELIKFGGSSFKLEKDPIKMLTELKQFVVTARNECDEPMLQAIIDDITEVIAGTLYKLKNLK